jgi:hypothetical protein
LALLKLSQAIVSRLETGLFAIYDSNWLESAKEKGK